MANRKRPIVLRCPVTAEERALIEQKMAQLHTKRIGAYLRKMAIDGYIIQVDTTDIKMCIRDSPKPGVARSSRVWDAKNTAASRFSLVCSVYFSFSRLFRSCKTGRILCATNVYPAKKKRTISTALLRKIVVVLIGFFGLTCRWVPPRAAQPGYWPVPETAGAVPPGPPNRVSSAPVPSAPPADGPPEDSG